MRRKSHEGSPHSQVPIDRTFPLSQAAEAHRYLVTRKSMGKVVLIP